MSGITLDFNELSKRHEVYSMFFPGVLLLVGAFLIWFYPNLPNWALGTGLVLTVGFLCLSYVIGMGVLTIGNLIEKIFIEKLCRLDLKYIKKIENIIGKSNANKLIDKYELKKSTNHEWSLEIKKRKRELSDEKIIETVNSYNRNNKLLRGMITDCILLFIIGSYRYGSHVFLNPYIIIITIFLIGALTWKMLGYEKRELEILYDIMLDKTSDIIG